MLYHSTLFTDCLISLISYMHIAYCEVWQKSNETDFLLTMNFIVLQNKVIPFQIVPLGSYTASKKLFP
jgi:hypothetical protein